MGYELQAIIARTTSFDRYQGESWYRYVVRLNQGFSLLPLHELAWDASGLWDDTRRAKHPPESVEAYFGDAFVSFLQVLSQDGAAAYLRVDCAGGICHKWGAVFKEGTKVLDQDMDFTRVIPKMRWEKGKGSGKWWRKYEPTPEPVSVRNPKWNPSQTDNMLGLLGVVAEGDLDAWDELGLGRFRETAEWPGGPDDTGSGVETGEDPVS